LQLGNRTPKRRAKAKLREDRAPATWPNGAWAMDCVHAHKRTQGVLRARAKYSVADNCRTRNVMLQ
jgi:putative transposase